MGTPAHSLPYRPDNKLYRLQTPQAPVVQTATHGEYKMDEYPNGTNAVVGELIARTLSSSFFNVLTITPNSCSIRIFVQLF